MSALSVIISAAAVLVSATLGLSSALRAQYDRVINVLDYISSEQVAQARHEMGLIIHSEHMPKSERMPKTAYVKGQRISDLFVILWAFQRVNAVRLSLPPNLRWLRGPHALLRANVEPWVWYWDAHLKDTAEGLGADIKGSDVGLKELAKAWGVRGR